VETGVHSVKKQIQIKSGREFTVGGPLLCLHSLVIITHNFWKLVYSKVKPAAQLVRPRRYNNKLNSSFLEIEK
jgi:hypothetical protein